ncbi:MAG TPA: hypothetical protein VEA92_00920 [Candidatus Paceibacterota bacterium]|nr:hypothetical protein [Candidatus Paceibacterota bacterium]
MNKTLAFVLSVLLLSSPLYSSAQEAADLPEPEAVEQQETAVLPETVELPARLTAPEGLTSCFETYRFGSVYADLAPSLTEASQSSSLAFSGTITNENPYPVSDITIWAKVFKVRTEGKDINGPDVLAWEAVATDLTLKAGETRPLSYEWFVPADAEPGNYQLATYVTNFDRFELSGLTFTDDIVGMKNEFTVVGDSMGAVRFDKDGVTVADRTFYFAAYPPTLPRDTESVPVVATIVNTTPAPYFGTVTWKLHYWDRITNRTLISESTEEVQVNPNETATVSYTVDDTDHAVYYLVGELETELGSKSIIGVRFVREGVQEARLNFVTGTPDPESGKGVAVACIHATNYTPVENGRIELSARRSGLFYDLLAPFGIGDLGFKKYEGLISSEIYALEMPLTAAAASYVVSAKLYQGDELVDQVSVPYCEGDKCASMIWVYVSVGLILLSLIGIGVYVLLRRRRTTAIPQPPVTPTV